MTKRFKGRKARVHWCGWKDCPLSVKLTEVFCKRHRQEALDRLFEHGYLRPEYGVRVDA